MLHDTKHDLSQDSQDLLNAADYIDQHGWCQKKIKTLSGEVCLFGALVAVTDGFNGFMPNDHSKRARPLYNKICDYLKILNGWNTGAANWNDARARTKTEVTALLRQIALKSKE